MQTDFDNKITELEGWTRQDLVAEWAKVFGRPAPRRISQNLLVRALVFKWHEQVFGGLSQADQKRLDHLVQAFKKNATTFKPMLQIKNGTRLRRIWQGKIYEVTATQDGFLYDGQNYRSLSEIARLITGTRWNGLLFFGLKKGKKVHDKAQA